MAVRRWGGPIATAVGMAAAAGAAQLGLGYGLGIVAWLPDSADSAWPTSLVWVAWIAATSVIIGAICAGRLAPTGPDEPATAATRLWRLTMALAAGLGALLTVVLVAVPARMATGVDISAPQLTAAEYALAGVVLGLVVAVWVLSSQAVAANVVATMSWLWLLAVVAVVDAVVSGRTPTVAQLGAWQFAWPQRFWSGDRLHWPTAALSVVAALLIGSLVARSYAKRSGIRVGVIASGVVGPLLVAGIYLLATPRLTDSSAEQISAAFIAPYAALAGLAGSVAMAARAQRAKSRALLAQAAAVPPAMAADKATVDEPPADEAGEQPATEAGEQPGVPVPTQPTSGPEPHDPTLPDDAAPARAYVSDFAANTAEAQPASQPPAVAPLWPTETGLADEQPVAADGSTQTDPAKPEKKSRRSGRRSK